MEYQIGGQIISKKNHACGGNEWEVARLGADIKLKCKKCGKALFLTKDQVDKIVKTYSQPVQD